MRVWIESASRQLGWWKMKRKRCYCCSVCVCYELCISEREREAKRKRELERASEIAAPQARLGPRCALGFPSSDSPPSSCHHVVDSYVQLTTLSAPRRADQPLSRPAPPRLCSALLCSALPSSSSSPPSLEPPSHRHPSPCRTYACLKTTQVCTPRAVSRASSAASATSAPTPTSSRSRASPTPRRPSSTSARLAALLLYSLSRHSSLDFIVYAWGRPRTRGGRPVSHTTRLFEHARTDVYKEMRGTRRAV